MFINISPCDETGKCMGEEYFVEDSTELLGKPYHYKVLYNFIVYHFCTRVSVQFFSYATISVKLMDIHKLRFD